MINWIREKWGKIVEEYEISSGKDIIITDNVTNIIFSVVDWIKELDERINALEDDNLWLKSEVNRLSQENIETTNELYRLENSLDARIDILAEHYRGNLDV
jgi:uncharacterized protein YsxB (DUF464 family)